MAIIAISDRPIASWSDAEQLPPGRAGEIVVRGPVVTERYYNRQDSTALAKIADARDGTIWHRMGDLGKLDELGAFVGGRGCVTRYGYLAYAWGDHTRRGDVASACKPLNAHFLFKAAEEGRVPGLDQRVSEWEPRLNEINADLPGFSQIRKFTLLEREFTLDDGELTPTMKIKRHRISEKYR